MTTIRKHKWLRIFAYSILGLLVSLYLILKFLVPIAISSEVARTRINQILSDSLARPVTFVPHLRVSWSLAPHLTIGDLVIGNPPELAAPAPLMTLKSAEIALDAWKLLSGTVTLPALRFESGSLSLWKSVSGESNWQFPSRSASATSDKDNVTAAPWLPEIELIEVKKFAVEYRDQQSQIVVPGEISSLAVKHLGTSAPTLLEAEASLHTRPFSLKAELAPVAQFFTQEKWPLKLHIGHAGLKLDTQGSLQRNSQDAVSGETSFQFSGTELVTFLASLGLQLPLNIQNATLEGNLNYDSNSTALTITEGSFGSALFQAALTYRPAATEFQGKLAVQNLDLPAVLPIESSRQPEVKVEAAQKFLFSESPLALVIPETPHGAVELQLTNFTASKDFVFSDVAATLRLENQDFEVSQLKATGMGSHTSADFRLGKSGVHLALQSLNLPFDKISEASGVKGGSMDLHAELKGQGDSLRAIASSLQGELEAKIRSVELTGGGLFFSTSNLFEILNPLAEKGKPVAFTCAIAKFKVHDGMAKSLGIASKVGDISILGDGSINLKNESLSLGFVPKSSSVGASTLVPPLKVYGTLLHPTIVPNPLGLATAQLDTVQSLVTGSISTLGGLADELETATGLKDEDSAKHKLSPDEICAQIIAENAGTLTSLVGGLVFGTSSGSKESHESPSHHQ
ncbi:MAG: AsmA family protein [Deltaproteobacteria bacterium]|nr:AsmA family protein [Deltaproteobacteria bacterium]